MKKLVCTLGAVASLAISPLYASSDSPAADSHDRLAIDMATRAIFTATVIPKTESGKYLCARERMACAGVNQGELGVLLLAASDSKAHLTALVAAVRFATDAGLSELLTCKIGEKGKDALNALSALSVKGLRNQCESNFAEYKRPGSVFGQLQANDACRTPEQLEIRLKEVREMLESGRRCE